MFLFLVESPEDIEFELSGKKIEIRDRTPILQPFYSYSSVLSLTE